MCNFLLLLSEFSMNSDNPDHTEEEEFITEETAHTRMMELYHSLTNGNPDEIDNADSGKHWATINYLNGESATLEIMQKV